MKNTLCLIVKNEAQYILEWIAYHKAIGFDSFAIFDNESTDGTTEILECLARAGIVNYHVQEDVTRGSQQRIAYNRCIDEYRRKTDLITFIDTDEFIASPTGVAIPGYIEQVFTAHADMAAMAINWRIFGSSGRDEAGEGLVIERFQLASKDVAGTMKSVVRPEAVEEMFTHYANLRDGRYGDEKGRAVKFQDVGVNPAPGGITTPSAEFLQVNHYMIKSREEFSAKITRGNANYPKGHPHKYKRFDDDYFSKYDRNDVADKSALVALPKVSSIHYSLCEICRKL